MNSPSPVLRLAPGVMVRPMADGSIVLVGEQPPVVIGSLHERLLAVCSRPTERAELVEVMDELGEFDRDSVLAALDELIERGLLAVS
jgi:hypothetical protein